jgi:hypothetical protein
MLCHTPQHIGTFADVEITSAGAYILKGKEKDEK